MNLRPSGYEPDELPGCSTPRQFSSLHRDQFTLFSRFGGDLLSRVLRRSTIGVGALNGRVRDGIGCFASAMTTKPRKKRSSVQPFQIIPARYIWAPNDLRISQYCSKSVSCTPCGCNCCVLYDCPEADPWPGFPRAWSCCYWIKSSLSSN